LYFRERPSLLGQREKGNKKSSTAGKVEDERKVHDRLFWGKRGGRKETPGGGCIEAFPGGLEKDAGKGKKKKIRNKKGFQGRSAKKDKRRESDCGLRVPKT